MLLHGALFVRSFPKVVTDHKRDTLHIILAMSFLKERGKIASLVELVSEGCE